MLHTLTEPLLGSTVVSVGYILLVAVLSALMAYWVVGGFDEE